MPGILGRAGVLMDTVDRKGSGLASKLGFGFRVQGLGFRNESHVGKWAVCQGRSS